MYFLVSLWALSAMICTSSYGAVSTIQLQGVIRDHCGATTAASGGFPACTHHIDFENIIATDHGVVSQVINKTDRTPVWSGVGGDSFHGPQWFQTVD